MQEIGPSFSLFHYESLLSKVYRRDTREETHRHKSKGVPEELSEVLKRIKSTMNCELIEEGQSDQCKKCSVFKNPQDGSSKQQFVAIMFYDLAI